MNIKSKYNDLTEQSHYGLFDTMDYCCSLNCYIASFRNLKILWRWMSIENKHFS